MCNSCPQYAYLYHAFTKQMRLYGHPAEHVNVMTLKWEIIWTGGLPHLNGLPYLPGVPHLYVNRTLGSTRSHRDLAKSRRVLGEISFISPKCLSSRRDLIAISEKLQISPRSSFIARESRRDLVSISPEIAFISCRSQRHHKSRRVLDEISARSHLFRRDFRDITSVAEFSSRFR